MLAMGDLYARVHHHYMHLYVCRYYPPTSKQIVNVILPPRPPSIPPSPLYALPHSKRRNRSLWTRLASNMDEQEWSVCRHADGFRYSFRE